MRPKRHAYGGAAILAATIMIVMAPHARAECACPAGSQWIAAGQSTKADKCNLAILLRRIDTHVLQADRYVIFVKSDMIPLPAGEDAPKEYIVAQNSTVSIPAGACHALLIGAHRSSQKDTVELNWSYF